MLNKKYLSNILKIIVILLVLLIIGIKKYEPQWLNQSSLKEVSLEKEIDLENRESHMVTFEDKELFLKSVGDYSREDKRVNSEIKGGVIPHHLLPSFIIADFFSQLSDKDIETIILVGPNHYERGEFDVIGSKYNWDTPLGLLEPNINIISDLEENKLIKIDEGVIALDHSITSILPFIKHYLPQVKIVPLILSKSMREGEISDLVTELSQYIQNDKAIMVASVDFSHYLTNFEAKEKNKQSLHAIEKRAYSEILSFGNDYVDSPASLVLLLKTMEASNANHMTVLHDTNSGEMLEDNFSQITSYLGLYFTASK